MRTISQEDYLKQVFVLQQEKGGAVAMGAIASAMGVAPASVTGMVKSMVERGLMDYQPYVGVSLTGEGERAALDVVRRHRLIEAFLVKTLGLDWSEVHEEAERLEHAVSDKLLKKIDQYLGGPTVDPHGDPIPAADGRVNRTRRKNLGECEPGQRVRLLRVTDQDPKFLRFLDRVALRPGAELKIEAKDPHAQTVSVRLTGRAQKALSAGVAAKLLVEPC